SATCPSDASIFLYKLQKQEQDEDQDETHSPKHLDLRTKAREIVHEHGFTEASASGIYAVLDQILFQILGLKNTFHWLCRIGNICVVVKLGVINVYVGLKKFFDTFEIDLLVLIKVQEIFLWMLDEAAKAAAHPRVGTAPVLFDADAALSSRKGKIKKDMTRFHTRLAVAVVAAIATIQTAALAQGETPAAYDCENISVEGHAYNISVFKSTTFTITGVPKDDHPNRIRVDYQLNPCQAIVIPEGEAKTHCKAGTWVCQDTKLIPEEGNPTTAFLRTIAGSAPATDNTPERTVSPTVSRAEKIDDVKELPWNLTLKGGIIDGQDQFAIITFICDMAVTDDKVGPNLTKYENGIVYFSWKSGHACPKTIVVPSNEGMGGFSVFLTILAVFGMMYIILGALYNRKVYGATGLDLLPHIDFWRDFPSLVVDVVRHVWDSVTARATRGTGYVSV
ncbi:hypothetical protein EDD11_005952, partial [Mortierella claussenii]